MLQAHPGQLCWPAEGGRLRGHGTRQILGQTRVNYARGHHGRVPHTGIPVYPYPYTQVPTHHPVPVASVTAWPYMLTQQSWMVHQASYFLHIATELATPKTSLLATALLTKPLRLSHLGPKLLRLSHLGPKQLRLTL